LPLKTTAYDVVTQVDFAINYYIFIIAYM